MNERMSTQEILSEIRMTRPQKKIFILFEGEDDLSLFGDLLLDDSYQPVICGGKPNTMGVINTVNSEKIEGVLAIVDRDYDFLIGEIHPDNCLCTDYRDIEVMLVMSSAFFKIISEYCDKDKVSHTKTGKVQFRKKLVRSMELLGRVRLTSVEHGLSLKFTDLKIKDILGANNEISEKKMISHLIKRSGMNKKESKHIDDCFKHNKTKKYPLLELVRGHDITAYLCYLLNLKLKKSKYEKKIEQMNVEKDLRLAYNDNHFQDTNLYRSIKIWQKNLGWNSVAICPSVVGGI